MPHKDPEKRKAYLKAWVSKNREKVNAKSREAYASDPRRRERKRTARYYELKRAQSKRRYSERRDEILKWQSEYRDRNREQVRALKRAWMKANRGYARALCAKWNAAKYRACPPWVDLKAVEYIYQEAVWLTRKTGTQFEVDHIVPLQGKTVCGLHVPWNMQILTRSENARKGNRFAA